MIGDTPVACRARARLNAHRYLKLPPPSDAAAAGAAAATTAAAPEAGGAAADAAAARVAVCVQPPFKWHPAFVRALGEVRISRCYGRLRMTIHRPSAFPSDVDMHRP